MVRSWYCHIPYSNIVLQIMYIILRLPFNHKVRHLLCIHICMYTITNYWTESDGGNGEAKELQLFLLRRTLHQPTAGKAPSRSLFMWFFPLTWFFPRIFLPWERPKLVSQFVFMHTTFFFLSHFLSSTLNSIEKRSPCLDWTSSGILDLEQWPLLK
jgi:hypothetical protein